MKNNKTCQESEPFIYFKHERISVSRAVADFDRKYRQNQRYYARRDGKCGNEDFRSCIGDCGHCRWYQEGYRMLSFTKVFGECGERESTELSNTEQSIEEEVLNRLSWKIIDQKLDQVIPNGAMVFHLRARDYTQREIAEAVGGISQTTLNYRIRKLDAYIREHRAEFEELLK